MTLCSAVVG